MCVSHSSGERHHKAKEKEDGHVHGKNNIFYTVLLIEYWFITWVLIYSNTGRNEPSKQGIKQKQER